MTWRAKQPWLDKYDGGYKGRFATEYGDDGPHGSNGKDLTEKEQEHVRALYDSNVSYQDDLLGQIQKKLEGWGIWDQTMLIVIADHGDEQWEDGRVGHGGSERETLLHVPLLIHYPPMFPAGKVTEGAEAIDIVPTIADALGVAADPEWQGTSLIPLANGVGGYPLMSFSSQYENAHAGRIGHWKAKLMGTGAAARVGPREGSRRAQGSLRHAVRRDRHALAARSDVDAAQLERRVEEVAVGQRGRRIESLRRGSG